MLSVLALKSCWWLFLMALMGNKADIGGDDPHEKQTIHKLEIFISDYIFAGSLAAAGGGLSMGTERKHREQNKPSAYLSGWRQAEKYPD